MHMAIDCCRAFIHSPLAADCVYFQATGVQNSSDLAIVDVLSMRGDYDGYSSTTHILSSITRECAFKNVFSVLTENLRGHDTLRIISPSC